MVGSEVTPIASACIVNTLNSNRREVNERASRTPGAGISCTMAVWHPFGFSTSSRRDPTQGLGAAAGASAPGASVGGGATALFCDPCDKSFPNRRAMLQHLSSHVKCTECSFEASQAILGDHVQSVHSTGARWTYVSTQFSDPPLPSSALPPEL